MEGIFLINLYIQLEKLNKHLNYWVMMNRKNSFLILKKTKIVLLFIGLLYQILNISLS